MQPPQPSASAGSGNRLNGVNAPTEAHRVIELHVHYLPQQGTLTRCDGSNWHGCKGKVAGVELVIAITIRHYETLFLAA